MSRTYECMFLIDNDAVRAGWQSAKDTVKALVEKYDGKVLTARRWGEQRLAYPIRRRQRATFLLAYCEFPPDTVNGLRRDLDISETVLRYLMMRAEAIPAEEVELSNAETAPDFVVPEPPADDAPDPEPEPEVAEATAEDGEKKAGADAAEKAEKPEKAEKEGEPAEKSTESEKQEPVTAASTEAKEKSDEG